jgi:hypothetical protein
MGREKIEKLLPKEYKWKCQGTKREKKKGRAPERNFGIDIFNYVYTVRNPKARKAKFLKLFLYFCLVQSSS